MHGYPSVSMSEPSSSTLTIIYPTQVAFPGSPHRGHATITSQALTRTGRAILFPSDLKGNWPHILLTHVQRLVVFLCSLFAVVFSKKSDTKRSTRCENEFCLMWACHGCPVPQTTSKWDGWDDVYNCVVATPWFQSKTSHGQQPLQLGHVTTSTPKCVCFTFFYLGCYGCAGMVCCNVTCPQTLMD